MSERVTILGIEIDALTMDGAIAAIERLIVRKRPSLVCNLNVHLCMRAVRDPSLGAIYRSADLVLVDGTPMLWAAKFVGTPLPGRVSGSDLVPAFCRVAAKCGYRIYLLGAMPGVAERAKDRLVALNPGLRIVGTYSPPQGFEHVEGENARIVDLVREAAPDVLFAAFGPGKQEKWLSRFYVELNVPASMGIGSTFDYLAGRLKRAPLWMQRAGLEWAFRLVQEPSRLWRRYLLEDPPFFYHVVRWRLGFTPDRSSGAVTSVLSDRVHSPIESASGRNTGRREIP